ncbi:MAG: FAD-binding oxidoreductase, partial [Pseudomonadota bacterium]
MTHRVSNSTTPLTCSATEPAGAPQPSGTGATSTPGAAADTRGERAPSRTLTADVLVVGAGILGLHAAGLLARQNARVVLCDPVDPRTDLTAGTATPLGALMPHMPDKWNAKKQFQFDALVSLEDLAGALHSDTGHDPGYARCGRVMPIRTEHFKGLAEQRCQESARNWQSDQVVKTPDALRMSLEPPGTGAAWLDPEVAPHGVFKDPLAARIDARAYRRALAVQCADLPMCAALFNHALVSLDHTARRAQIAATDGTGTVQVDYHIVLMAAGFQ